MLDRIERHDLLNAVALSVVLLGCVFLVLRWVDAATGAWDDGFWAAEKPAEPIFPTDDDPRATALVLGQHAPNEISVLVANGSDGIDGLAGRGTSRLTAAGYGTLAPQDISGDAAVAESIVYYQEGYRPDAQAIAIVLGLPETGISPLLNSPGVNVEGADVVVVLGDDAAR